MMTRANMLLSGQFFLAMVFLCSTLVDNIHAVSMQRGDRTVLQSVQSTRLVQQSNSSLPPCHVSMATPAVAPEQAPAVDAGDKEPCCPDKQCSANNCLMHFAFVEQPVFAIVPHSPIDTRRFSAIFIRLATLPFAERLRPPIA